MPACRQRPQARQPAALHTGRAVRPVLGGATGRDLIPSLRDAGVYELVYGVASATALIVVAR